MALLIISVISVFSKPSWPIKLKSTMMLARHSAGKRSSCAGQYIGAVPRQEVVAPIHRVVGDVRQRMAQPGFGVDTTQPGRSGQPLHGGSAFASTVGAGK